MALKASFKKQTFHFGFAARTSRGAMRERNSWFIRLEDDRTPEVYGLGECGPLPGLSPEDIPAIETTLTTVTDKLNSGKIAPLTFSGDASADVLAIHDQLTGTFGETFVRSNPAIVVALETALLDLGQKGTRLIFDNSFVKGQPIPINGLVWMGGLDFMLQQVEIKIRDGFKCVKIKIGGLDFDRECDILQYIRRKYFRDNIVIRLDANGAFKPEEAMFKLNSCSRFDVHSIEQPVKVGYKELPRLCRDSPIPVALDEELIGVNDRESKEKFLDSIQPRFLVLKPTLHGGFFGCMEWIELADARKIGWWITSAMESSVGLNAISQFAANYAISMPQGLGTGSIFTDNIPSPLHAEKGFLSYNPKLKWDLGDTPEEESLYLPER